MERIAYICLGLVMLMQLAACGGGGGSETADNGDSSYYTIGGTVSGLETRDLVLQINGGDDVSPVEYYSRFEFRTRLLDGSHYEVTIASQPSGQRCWLSNASGTVAGADNFDLVVTCSNVYSLGGTVAGMTGSGLVLLSNGADDLTVAGDGGFVFDNTLPDGDAYEVTIANHPENQTCRVANGNGNFAGSNIVNVRVICLSSDFQPLVSATSPKVLTLFWSDQGADHYRLLKNPDGISGYTRLGGDIRDTQAQDEIAVHMADWLNMSYIVQSCSSNEVCVDSSPISPAAAMLDAIGYFKASNTGSSSSFGGHIALSADGTTMAVAALGDSSPSTGIDGDQHYGPGYHSGAVFLFVREGATWRQQAYIKSSNSESEDSFGGSLALSSNGDVLAVGARLEDSAATGIDGDQADNSAEGSGAVYLFERSAGSWTQQAYIKASNTGASDTFGTLALSADGNTLAVAARMETSDARGITMSRTYTSGRSSGPAMEVSATGLIGVDQPVGESSGAVYLFVHTDQGWSQQAYIKASNADSRDFFGWAIALSADGNTLAVAAWGEDSLATGINGDQTDNSGEDAGAVYLFSRNAGSWEQQAYLKSSNPESKDYFGISISLSKDGNRLAVGAHAESSSATGVNGDQTDNSAPYSGAVYIFGKEGGDWRQQAYIKASNTEENDEFGSSVALSADGAILAVGAPYERSAAVGIGGDQGNDLHAGFNGAVYLFKIDAGIWLQHAYIKSPISDSRNFFGSGLAISDDGSTLAVGMPGDDSAATGVNGDRTDTSIQGAGAVYLY